MNLQETTPADINWYAVHVKSRHEFVSSGELNRKGIENFLPSVMKLRQWKDRKKDVEFPLFPGYLFVRIPLNSEDYLKVLQTRGIVTFISLYQSRPTAISDTEIVSLKLMIESGSELDIYPQLKEGMPVNVKRGALKGASGILKQRGKDYFFIVNIDILSRSVGVKIYADDIEAA